MPEQDITIEQVDLVALCDATRAFLIEQGSTASVVFGRREPTRQDNQGAGGANRVVFVPGDLSGKGGELVGGVGTKFPFQIAGYLALFTVHIWGHDATAPNDERAHYRAHRTLFQLVVNALLDTMGARVQFVESEWTMTPVERVFGCSCAYVWSLEDPIPSLPIATMPAHPAEQPIVTTSLVTPAGSETVD